VARRIQIRALIAVVVVLIAAAGAFEFARWRTAHKPKPAPVAAAPALPGEVTFAGHVQPRTIVNVAPQLEGVLDTYFVELGQEIYQAQLLGRVRNPELDQAQKHGQSELDQAELRVTKLTGEQLAARLESSRAAADQARAHSEVERLQKNYDRQKGLWEAGATPRLAWEKAQKDYTDAKADIDRQDVAVKSAAEHEASIDRDLEAANHAVSDATTALEHARGGAGSAEIHSPVDGIVLARKELQGQRVDPSMTDLMQIATDLTSLQAVATPDASVLPRIHAGQAAAVRIPEVNPDPMNGTVREVRGADVIVDFTSPVAITKLDLAAQVMIKF
jgi:multidrug resistance efflux pump